MSEMVEVWLTSYWSTRGVIKAQGKLISKGCVEVGWPEPGDCIRKIRYFGEGRHWHRTEASARASVEALRRKRIEAFQRQIRRTMDIPVVVFTMEDWTKGYAVIAP